MRKSYAKIDVHRNLINYSQGLNLGGIAIEQGFLPLNGTNLKFIDVPDLIDIKNKNYKDFELESKVYDIYLCIESYIKAHLNLSKSIFAGNRINIPQSAKIFCNIKDNYFEFSRKFLTPLIDFSILAYDYIVIKLILHTPITGLEFLDENLYLPIQEGDLITYSLFDSGTYKTYRDKNSSLQHGFSDFVFLCFVAGIDYAGKTIVWI